MFREWLNSGDWIVWIIFSELTRAIDHVKYRVRSRIKRWVGGERLPNVPISGVRGGDLSSPADDYGGDSTGEWLFLRYSEYFSGVFHRHPWGS